ncbi:hypothetical protein FOA43_001696 [Brettanomyces nanus]|uniref:Protein arginine methyltransferase NDUFAF7 n=1 Tax=Eeniella nana TaxID=13502 RepID=A0A875S3J5_EENNA|nr:uncharacterized protein FOA43_001696 [Brettanomyces nanus]QPG74369.1 hypothetical protein FOA43_001696 [Brettanomyces nanus]
MLRTAIGPYGSKIFTRSFRTFGAAYQTIGPRPIDALSENSQKLAGIIKNLIQATGPITISNYMKQCLINPQYGYYTTRDPLSVKTGDFVTSPEISSTFGEMCGMWFFSCFIGQLKYQATYNREKFKIDDKTFRFIEYGPGRGTMMYDMLRVLNRLVSGNNPIEVVFVEKSDILIQEQFKAVCDSSKASLDRIDDFTYRSQTKWGNRVLWLKDDKPVFGTDGNYMNFVIAHEFFDALPIERFVKTDNGWREFVVDLKKKYRKDSDLSNVSHATTSSIEMKDDCPQFVIVESSCASPSSSIPKIDPRFDNLVVGSKVEICPEAHSYLYEMADVVKQGDIGAGLIIDYGKMTTPIETLRGIRHHKFVDPLTRPGEVDLSADVDFGKLISLLRDQKDMKSLIAEQGDWLDNMGLGYRIDQLIAMHDKDLQLKKNIISSYNRLTSKKFRDMGKVYKVLGFYDQKYTKIKVPGFERPNSIHKTSK